MLPYDKSLASRGIINGHFSLRIQQDQYRISGNHTIQKPKNKTEPTASISNSIRVCYAGLMHSFDDQRFVHKQCASLVRAGYDVVYFARGDIKSTINGVKIYPLPSASNLSLLKRSLAPWRLLPRLLREDCRVYHFLDPEMLPLGLILKLFSNRRVLFDAHEDYVEYARVSPYIKGAIKHICAFAFRILLALASRTYDGFVFGDDEIAKEYPHLDLRKICFHHFPLLSMFPASSVPFAQRKYDVVYVGNLSKDKGAFIMLEAIKLLRERCQKLRALLIGEPRKYIKEEFHQYINEHKLDDCLDITGLLPYEKVPGLLDQCKVGLIGLLDLPKFRKQSATKLFEYMAKGVPVVSADLVPERKYVTSGVHGYLVEAENPQAMADAAYNIITDPELGEKMAKACREQVVNKKLYAEEDCEKLLAFYDFILTHPRRLLFRNRKSNKAI